MISRVGINRKLLLGVVRSVVPGNMSIVTVIRGVVSRHPNLTKHTCQGCRSIPHLHCVASPLKPSINRGITLFILSVVRL